ncbi:MAG: hypothetical protein JWP44_4700 [Mucilaginibacter sp.]|nr:hypothetical protein [Mucilaginibacter sp.]
MARLRYIFFIMFLTVIFISCQKDAEIKEFTPLSLKADSVNALAAISAPGDVLAVTGTLKITIQDSTYTFDAAKDSIAFVNLYLDSKKYFGITAINKAHTMSFGISSSGYPGNNITSTVAGSQFLFSRVNNPSIQYTLSQFAGMEDPGKIMLTQYSRDSVLAKGTFIAYLAKDTKANSVFYKAEGSFDLRSK